MKLLSLKKFKINSKSKLIKIICAIICILIVAAIIYGAVNFAVLKSYRNKELKLSDSFTVTAHTGSMNTPDNSIESIEKAISTGADVVEFDVRFRPNGTPVMAHDAVESDGAGVPIEDALKFIAQSSESIKINLDVKETDNLSEVQDLVKKYGLPRRAFFTGVNEEFVPEVKRQCPEIPYYLNYSPEKSKLNNAEYKQKLLEILESTGAVGINCNYKNSNKILAELLHEHGYLLSVWTVDKENQMVRELVSGADNITSRNPDKLIDLIKNWNSDN